MIYHRIAFGKNDVVVKNGALGAREADAAVQHAVPDADARHVDLNMDRNTGLVVKGRAFIYVNVPVEIVEPEVV